MEPLLKIVLVQTHSELSETDNLWDESELIACKVCVGRRFPSYQEAIAERERERGESGCVVWSLDTGYWIEYISPVNPRLIQRGRGLLLYVLRLSLAIPKIIKLTSKTDSPLVGWRVSQGPPWYSPWWWVDPQIPHSTCAVIEYSGNAIYILWYKQ